MSKARVQKKLIFLLDNSRLNKRAEEACLVDLFEVKGLADLFEVKRLADLFVVKGIFK